MSIFFAFFCQPRLGQVRPNTINTVVTAQDGVTTKTYTITVTRAPSTNALYTSISLSPVTTLVGTTGPGYLNFTASVTYSTSSIQVIPTAKDPNATITVNGAAVSSGSASLPVALNVGPNTITTVVTAQNGITSKTVYITVNRAGASTNALFTSISLSPSATLVGTTGPAYLNFTAAVPYSETSVQVIPTAKDPNATIKVNGTAVTSGTASTPIALNAGSNTITTVVRAQDGITTKTCIITVNRAGPSTNALFASISLSPASTLVGATGPGYLNFTASVANSETSVQVIAAAKDANATITVNGVAAAAGIASSPVALNVGPNLITTIITAQDGSTSKTCYITITRAPSSDAALTSLAISSGTLSPAFASTTSHYTATVPYTTTSVAVTATTGDPTATVNVNGSAVISGSASASIPLSVGLNTITTIVTAQNGTTTQTFIITITRGMPSTNALLASISLSPVSTLVGTTGTGYLNFKSSVANSESSVQVIPAAKDATAIITVNGAGVASGVASSAIPLSVGANTITTVITAQDGITTKTITITVTRAAGPIANPDQAISVEQTATTAGFENDGIIVHQGVSPNGDGINDFLVIDGISAFPDNKLTIINTIGVLVFETKGYDNYSKVFDGHSSKTGALQVPGTYFYALDYSVNGVAMHKTGFIVLKY